jgi:hypothetical protein
MTLMPKSKSERALLVFGIVLLVVGLSYALADLRGNSAWEKYKREWEAKGEKFDFKDFVPKQVPDDQNFALAPIVVRSYAANLSKSDSTPFPPPVSIFKTDDTKKMSLTHWRCKFLTKNILQTIRPMDIGQLGEKPI